MLNNKVKLFGEIITDFLISHTHKNETFLIFDLKVENENKKTNIIKIITNEKLLKENNISKNDFVYIEGEFHSYNISSSQQNHLALFCFTKKISKEKFFDDKNFIFLNGYICKIPSIRIINNNLKICDVLVAVNRKYNKSDYIPCVISENEFSEIINKKVGDNISFNGIIQSRKYIKKISENILENKIAYEIVVTQFIKNNI